MFMKQIIQGISLIFLLFSGNSQAQIRQHINIDKDWKFSLGNASNPQQDFNYSLMTVFAKSGSGMGTAIATAFNDSSWQKIQLPHDWAETLPFVNSSNTDVESHGFKPLGGAYPATSIGWYRKHLKIEKADSGRRFQLQFDGVYRNADFWINGCYLGKNNSGYTGAVFDITDFIHFAKDNVITVRADATQFEGWYYEGAGIYRHVWLNTFGNTHITNNGIHALATITGNKAILKVQTAIVNEATDQSNFQVRTYLTDREGNQKGAIQLLQASNQSLEEKEYQQTILLDQIRLWSPEDPYLYRIVVELLSNGKIIDHQLIRFGFRTIELKVNGLFINGVYTKIKGTNNHQDFAGVGTAVPDFLWYYRVGLLKNMGSNAYRTSHNPPAPALLDACDSLGMLVLDENRLLNSGMEYMNQFEQLIKRDRNHASVFLWSIGNEEGWIQTQDIGKRIAQTLIGRLKKLDPTRTCTYAADVPNIFKGVNEVIPVRGFNYRQFAVDDYHRDHPLQPILGTEMGSTVSTRGILKNDSVKAYLADQDITAPWWASTAETWWKLAAPHDYFTGGFIWSGFDYRGEPTPFHWPNINSHFGVMDICGFPKNIYYYYKGWWSDQTVIHISPHWNWPEMIGKPIDVWVNGNIDSVTLFLNDQSLGKKEMPRNGHLLWSVDYTPGILKAVGVRKGQQVITTVETTGAPAEVVLMPVKTTMLADPNDGTVINVSVVDKAGREVPDADNLISFNIEGDAKIIGTGNGDPSSHEPDQYPDHQWKRHLFNGKCQVIIQSGTKPETIRFEATAAGLWKGSTDIVTVAPEKVATVTIDPQYTLHGEAASTHRPQKIVGADISFLPQLEDKGVRFSDGGITADPIQILKKHGFNYIRLRIFNQPANDSGYAPHQGYCDLAHTLQMAKRIKAAGLKFLLDFHYSDTWADPGKQFKPAAWQHLNFKDLKKAVYDYTEQVMQALQAQGTLPDMVQVGNEINHGLLWPDGSVQEIDQAAQLMSAGIAAVKTIHPQTIILIHLALGGQNAESVFFINNMVARKVHFDVIGLSFYPKWHGSPEELLNNLNDLAARYHKDVVVAEYSALKREVFEAVTQVPDGRGKGAFIWEPLNTWEQVFDRDGKANHYLLQYDALSNSFLLKP